MLLSLSRRRWRALPALALSLALTGCSGNSDNGQSDDLALTQAVGRTTLEWVDSSRAERCGGAAPGTPRRLQAFVWYPANPNPGAKLSPLVPQALSDVLVAGEGLDPAVIAQLPNGSFDEAPLAPGGGRLPVLLMSHANGASSPLEYASTASALAARGYVVVGLSHTYNVGVSAFADGSLLLGDPACITSSAQFLPDSNSSYADRLVALEAVRTLADYLSGDVGSLLQQLSRVDATDARFKGRLQLDRVGMFGHSFGGSHVFQALRELPQIAAAADLDGAIWTVDAALGVGKPFLAIASGDSLGFLAQRNDSIAKLLALGFTQPQAESSADWMLSMFSAFEASSPSYLLSIPSARHMNFTDAGLWNAYGIPADPAVFNVADSRAILDVQADVLRQFFDRHLRGKGPALHVPSTSLTGVTLQPRG